MSNHHFETRSWLDRAASYKQQTDIDRVIRLNELKAKTSLSKSAIYRAIEEGTFPPPFRIGKRAVGWRLSTVNAWLDAAEQNTRKAG